MRLLNISIALTETIILHLLRANLVSEQNNMLYLNEIVTDDQRSDPVSIRVAASSDFKSAHSTSMESRGKSEREPGHRFHSVDSVKTRHSAKRTQPHASRLAG